MPAVSIVIPCFNRAEYLRLALSSVCAQTFTDWECIVVDDGSTEDLSFAMDIDPRIRLFRQRNMGISAARNRGIFGSIGSYIAFLDSDDLWMPEKLALQAEARGSRLRVTGNRLQGD